MNTILSTALALFVCGQLEPQAIGPDANSVQSTQNTDVWQDYSGPAQPADTFSITGESYWTWTIGYRFRNICNSHTSYEFGTPPPPEFGGYAPLSRLDFPLNSNWHGLEFGLLRPTWGVRLEWLMPLQKGIDGDLQDFDWQIPDAPFTDLGMAQQKWIEGQMLDLDLEIRMWDEPFGLPLELWPVLGFRWQKFDIMCHDGAQYKSDDIWLPTPDPLPGDVITFNQQYYFVYLGTQIRTALDLGFIPPIQMKAQFDWGDVNAFNVDHHLMREGDRYTMESTHGDSWHTSFTAELPIRRHVSIGVQADYLQVDTDGSHHWQNIPEGTDEVWGNGVHVWSDQTWLTAFVRINI